MSMNNLAVKLLFSILVSLIIGRIAIPLLKRASIGQNVSNYGPESHMTKQGTPTMGGIIITLALIISMLVFRIFSKEMLIVALATFGFGLIGFIDDFLMLVMNKAEGLKPKEKIVLQVILSVVITLMIRFMLPEIFGVYRIPFLDRQVDLNLISYFLYPLVMVASVNAVNLTDGLDGLLSSVSIVVFIYLALVSSAMGPVNDFTIVFIGALIGFLAYNTNIASVFMGDTGSMTIGGAIGILSIITGQSLYLPLFGIIYVIEAGSVIIQVLSVKLRNGKKIFLMTPIHHGFEMKGYNEQKIVTGFTIVTLIAVLICILI